MTFTATTYVQNTYNNRQSTKQNVRMWLTRQWLLQFDSIVVCHHRCVGIGMGVGTFIVAVVLLVVHNLVVDVIRLALIKPTRI